MWNDIVIIEYDDRRPGLPNAPVVMEHENNRTEKSAAIALNIQNNPYITPTSTYSRTRRKGRSGTPPTLFDSPPPFGLDPGKEIRQSLGLAASQLLVL